LELIDVTGAIITMDAMGVQTEIVRLIRQKKADYIVTPQKESSNSLQTSQDLVLKSQSKPIWWN
jgi:predicted transposase YbfD/YdcC